MNVLYCSRTRYVDCEIYGLNAIAERVKSSSCISKCVLLLNYEHGRQ